MKTIRIRQPQPKVKSPWHDAPRWKKRLHGWASYQVWSWLSLIHPEVADQTMYNALKDQFKND